MPVSVNYYFEDRYNPVIRKVSGKRSVLDVLILFSNWFLGIVIARLICVVVSALFNPS